MTYRCMPVAALTSKHATDDVRDDFLCSERSLKTKYSLPTRAPPNSVHNVCFYDCARVCGVVLDTSICHSRPTAARITPRLYWQQSICSGGKAECKDGKYVEGKEKRFVFARAPAAASHFLLSEKRREHVQCSSSRDADTRFVCCANDPRRRGVFRMDYNSHIAIS